MSEATQSQAAMQAKKLGLSGDGHGGWVDRSGKVVARTEDGKLKFTGERKAKGKAEPASEPKKATTPQQPQVAAPAPQADPQQAQAASQEAQPEGEAAPTLTVVFGRFNPPTIGHEKLLKSAERASTGGDLKIYPSRTQDPKKNPLDPDTKISYMRKMFPQFGERIINDYKMATIFCILVVIIVIIILSPL